MALQITFADIRRELGLFLGWGRNTDSWTADNIADAQTFIDSGLRRFYYGAVLPVPEGNKLPQAHRWSFLEPNTSLSTVSGTDTYALPQDYAGNLKEFQGANGKIEIIPDMMLTQVKAAKPATGYPKYASIVPRGVATGGSQVFDIVFYPTPDAVYSLSYQYTIAPDSVTADNPYHLGGPQHSELVLEAVLAAAESKLKDVSGEHNAKFLELLAASIRYDRESSEASAVEIWPVDDNTTGVEITNKKLKQYIGQALGFGWNSGQWTHAQVKQIKLVLDTGRRTFLNPPILPGERWQHRWSFLSPLHRMSLTTGQSEHSLPKDFADMEGPINFDTSTSIRYRPIELTSESVIRQHLQSTDASARPVMASVIPLNPGEGYGFRLLCFPVPDESYDVVFRYRSHGLPGDDDEEIPYGGPPHTQTVIEAVLAAAEEMSGKPSVHSAKFIECLRASVAHDRQVASPQSLGYNGNREPMGGVPNWHNMDENIVVHVNHPNI